MADSNSHKALGYALLAYMTAVIAVVTLVPFEFVVPQKLQIALHGDVADVLTNILFSVPLGFFFQAALGRYGLKSLFWALCFDLLVSSTVEAGQPLDFPVVAFIGWVHQKMQSGSIINRR